MASKRRRLVGKQSVQSMGRPVLNSPQRRRLVGKQNVQAFSVLQPADGEDTCTMKMVYLVTLSHPKTAKSKEGIALVPPSRFAREGVRDAFLAVCASPHHDAKWLQRNPGFRSAPVPVLKLVVFREYHAESAGGERHLHYHVGILLEKQTRFMPLKRALLERFGLASHWSASHCGYWSVVRYGIRRAPHKPEEALDPRPLAWALGGEHPLLESAAAEPTNARALEARRTHQVQTQSGKGKPEPRVEEIDVWPVVVRAGVRNTPDDPYAAQRLVQYAKENCSQKMVAWLFKNRGRLPKLIDDVWAREEVDAFIEDVGVPRFDKFLAAVRGPCVCQGRWLHHVRESLQVNKINVPDLCNDVLQSLREGRSESVPTVVLLGQYGGEGKSLFFSALAALYGAAHVQVRPPGGNFSLLGIETKKVAVLDEWVFFGETLPIPTQLLWFEGKPVPVCRPQNVPGQSGHDLYRGTAPIFVTGPATALACLTQGAAAQPQGQASMLLRRLKIHHFAVPVQKPPLPSLVPCPKCFAWLVTTGAAEWKHFNGGR